MKMKSSNLLVLLMVAAFLSCGKESNKPVPVPGNSLTGKLAKVSFGSEIYDSLFYTQEGKLSKISVFFDQGGVYYKESFLFSYNANGKVDKVQIEQADEFRYTYVNGLLAAVSRYENGVKIGYKFYNYSLNGNKLESVEEYEKLTPGSVGFVYAARVDYNYHPDGNLKEEVKYQIDQFGQATKQESTLYEDYDQHVNVDQQFRNFLYMSGVQTMQHNPKKVTRKDATNGTEQVYNYQFNYTNKQTPAKRIMTANTGGPLGPEITYSYY